MEKKKLIEGFELDLCAPECVPGARGAIYTARVHIENDVSEVMPYLNAVLDRAQYGENNQFVIWSQGENRYALRPHELAVSTIWERSQAMELVTKAIAMINDIWRRRDEITPDYTRRNRPRVLDIFKLLPKTNCGECGLASCMAFAAQLSEGNQQLDDCPPLTADGNPEALRSLRGLGL